MITPRAISILLWVPSISVNLFLRHWRISSILIRHILVVFELPLIFIASLTIFSIVGVSIIPLFFMILYLFVLFFDVFSLLSGRSPLFLSYHVFGGILFPISPS